MAPTRSPHIPEREVRVIWRKVKQPAIYRRVCGDVEKGGIAIPRDDSRDFILLGLS